MTARTLAGLAGGVFTLTLVAAPLRAQEPGVQGYAPAAPTAGAPAPSYIFVPDRSPDAIRDEMEATRAELADAERALQRAEQDRAAARARIQAKKLEIDSIKARESLAKKEKREADVITISAERKVAENQRQFFEKMEDLRQVSVDLARRRQNAAKATQRRLELEQQLGELRRSLLSRTGDAATTDVTFDPRILELERKTLEARKKEMEARKDLADRETRLADARLKLFDAHLRTRGTRS